MSDLKNIWSTASGIYQATSSGINIYDIDTYNLVNYISYPTGINSVWADTDYIYMATSNSGIVRSEVNDPSNLFVYQSYPNITNNDVNYLHGNGNYLCITTVSGIDHIDITTNSGIFTNVVGASKCYQTNSGEFYYIVDDYVHVLYNYAKDWLAEDIDFSYQTDGLINDIYITEGTSSHDNANVLFIATTVGMVVIEEWVGNETNSLINYYFIE